MDEEDDRKRKHKAIELRRRQRLKQHFDELDSLCMEVAATNPVGKRKDKDTILVNAIDQIKIYKDRLRAANERIRQLSGGTALDSETFPPPPVSDTAGTAPISPQTTTVGVANGTDAGPANFQQTPSLSWLQGGVSPAGLPGLYQNPLQTQAMLLMQYANMNPQTPTMNAAPSQFSDGQLVSTSLSSFPTDLLDSNGQVYSSLRRPPAGSSALDVSGIHASRGDSKSTNEDATGIKPESDQPDAMPIENESGLSENVVSVVTEPFDAALRADGLPKVFCVLALQLDGAIRVSNEAARQLLGYTKEELESNGAAKSIIELSHVHDLARIFQGLQLLLQRQAPSIAVKLRLKTGKGDYVAANMLCALATTTVHVPSGYFCVFLPE